MTRAFLIGVGVLILLGSAVLSPQVAAQDASKGRSVAPMAVAPAGHADRYLIPAYASIASGSLPRSLNVVHVMNNGKVSCNVGVYWQFAFTSGNVCTLTLSILPGHSRVFCSRPAAANNPPCQASCNPGLTFNVGHAFVSSTAGADCNRLSVHAEQWYFPSGVDTGVPSVNRLSVTTRVRSNGD